MGGEPSITITCDAVNVGCDVATTSRASSQWEALDVGLQFGDFNLQ